MPELSTPPRERVFTMPNALTLSRLPMAAALWLAPERFELVVPLMVAAALTDVLDGRFARAIRAHRERRGEDPGALAGKGGIGAWLDPLCDKTFVLSLLAAIYVTFHPAWWIVLLIATRELFLVPLALFYRFHPTLRARLRFDFRAGLLGKAATVAQFGAVAAILIEPRWTVGFAVAAGVLGFAATIVYLRRALASALAAS